MSPINLHYVIGRQASAVTPQSPQWNAPLPIGRQDCLQQPRTAAGPTYGQYFSAAANFLQSGRWSALTRAAGQILDRRIDEAQISKVTIHLVKHGALYHPSVITVGVGEQVIRLVLNMATGAQGRQVLPQEYALLQKLNRLFPQNLIPRVYACGDADTDDEQPPWAMFLGQWLEGYHEFHISTDQTGRGNQWLLWDTDEGYRILSARQVAEIYRQCAYILAFYFNPITFEAIVDWHHAAGDFVLRVSAQEIQIRLITVRRYAPFIQMEREQMPSLQGLLEALLLFFLRSSLWLRLDRLDGVGEPAWADSFVLAPIWQGFHQGLKDMADLHGLPQELVAGMGEYLAAHSTRQLIRLGTAIVERIPRPAEKKIISDHLSEHVTALAAIVRLPGKTGLFY